MKEVYVILAFHAHELLWELPDKLLSYLEEGNPMKDSLTAVNYLKKRKEEGRDIYSRCSRFGDRLQAPLCVEFSNELLVQLQQVMPDVFEGLIRDYKRGRLYPLYGHAHHGHVSLLSSQELSQEILWNRQYLHNEMGVPYPEYKGLFPSEASLDYAKIDGISGAGIDYVVFPHLDHDKVHFEINGQGDYRYQPFLIKASGRKLLAFPRNFPISQEIWRPITRMKRDELKSQGYILGDYPVFNNEYYGDKEKYPISMEEGVALYKKVLIQELEKVPERGVLLYIQDLELMDYGDIALEIIGQAWEAIINQKEGEEDYRIRFVTPDRYIEEVLKDIEIKRLPELSFDKICWAPELRLVLRVDGHYPPLGVHTGKYSVKKSGLYDHPHVFWENGKYYCGIFDTLLANFGINTEIPVDIGQLGRNGYELAREEADTRAVLYLRLMKRACNWGWRPTEGRQKRPCLLAYLLCSTLLKKLENYPSELLLREDYRRLNPQNIVGLSEVLGVFIDGRLNYLEYGLKEYERKNELDMDRINAIFREVQEWKLKAVKRSRDIYVFNQQGVKNIEGLLKALQDYSQALYMATEHISRIWGECPEPEFLVDKMYHFLFRLYPPVFPGLLDRIEAMGEGEIREYFDSRKTAPVHP